MAISKEKQQMHVLNTWERLVLCCTACFDPPFESTSGGAFEACHAWGVSDLSQLSFHYLKEITDNELFTAVGTRCGRFPVTEISPVLPYQVHHKTGHCLSPMRQQPAIDRNQGGMAIDCGAQRRQLTHEARQGQATVQMTATGNHK